MAKEERSLAQPREQRPFVSASAIQQTAPRIREPGLRVARGSARVAALFFCFASTFAIGAVRADTFDKVTKLQDASASTVWRIDDPNVKSPSTSYQEIKFRVGDRVSIDAGGCVQTGGSGLTWKRYVDPSGPNSDRLYHGLIWIPGINDKLTTIQQFGLKQDHLLKTPLPADIKPDDLYLRLGYQDNDYRDNGYYSHDDGTGDQCKNVGDAWIIISIGHGGAAPPDPSEYVGITPETFRCDAGWAFSNFDTPDLSWSTFTNAFTLSPLDYIDPATYITYLAGEGLASSGNCFGMDLLATVGANQSTVDGLRESFWSNYKASTAPTVLTDINTFHWKQLSTIFLEGWLSTAFNLPSSNADTIEHDLTKTDHKYGLLSIMSGTEGHVLIPLRVTHSGRQTLIDVYDPNRPCSSPSSNPPPPQLIIEGETWSYDMSTLGTWSNTGWGLGYIPYVGADGWSDLGTNLQGALTIVFSNSVKVEQVMDSTGKRLYVLGKPGTVDTSAQGFGRGLVRVPKFTADSDPNRKGTIGPPFTLNHALEVPPTVANQGQELQKEYEADYAGSQQIYLATNASLSELTFTLSGASPGRPVRVLIETKGQFFEIKLTSASALTHPSLVIHSVGNLAAGVTVQDRSDASLKATFSHALVSTQNNTVTVRETDEILAATAPIRIQLQANNDIQLLSSGPTSQTRVSTRVIDTRGTVTNASVRQLPILRMN